MTGPKFLHHLPINKRYGNNYRRTHFNPYNYAPNHFTPNNGCYPNNCFPNNPCYPQICIQGFRECTSKKEEPNLHPVSLVQTINPCAGISFSNPCTGRENKVETISAFSNFSLTGIQDACKIILQNCQTNCCLPNCSTQCPTLPSQPLGKLCVPSGQYEYNITSDCFKFGPVHLGVDSWYEAIPTYKCKSDCSDKNNDNLNLNLTIFFKQNKPCLCLNICVELQNYKKSKKHHHKIPYPKIHVKEEKHEDNDLKSWYSHDSSSSSSCHHHCETTDGQTTTETTSKSKSKSRSRKKNGKYPISSVYDIKNWS